VLDGLLVVAPPFGMPATGGITPHATQVVAVVSHGHVRGGVGPVLDAPALLHELLQECVVIGLLARPENVFVVVLDDGDRVDLHVTDTSDVGCRPIDAVPGAMAAVEALGTQSESPRVSVGYRAGTGLCHGNQVRV
jgi:hypothetical protein